MEISYAASVSKRVSPVMEILKPTALYAIVLLEESQISPQEQRENVSAKTDSILTVTMTRNARPAALSARPVGPPQPPVHPAIPKLLTLESPL